MIQVLIELSQSTPAILKKLKEWGFQLTSDLLEVGMLEGNIPKDKVSSLSTLPGILRVTPIN